MQNDDTKLYLRDITQAYVQSNPDLNRGFYIRPPHKLVKMLGASLNCVLRVVKPLYGVPEAGNHWFATYHGHHIDKLRIEQSTYNPCLLYKSDPLGIVGLQTDNTLLLAEDDFADAKENALRHAKLMSKDREYLTINKPIKFNGALIELTPNGDLTLKQEIQIAGISLVKNLETSTTSTRGVVRVKLSMKEQYIAQRARRAYIVSICQPEAFFDLSHAAQSIEPTSNNVSALNKRLQ